MKLQACLFFVAVFCLVSLPGKAATYNQTYYGNAPGSSQVVGNGTLNVSGNVGGTINFSFNSGGGMYAPVNNLVFYLDTIPNAGFHDTSAFMDYHDSISASLSGFNGTRRTVATFANGFSADYAVVMNADGAWLYQLGQDAHTPITQLASFSGLSTVYQFYVARGDLQLTRSGALNFETAYMVRNPTVNSGLRTQETFETLNWSGNWDGWNNVSYSYFNVFPVPETTTIALPLFGGLVVLGGLGARLRRYWISSRV